MTEYYQRKLEQGQEYQDFICERLRQMTPARIIMPYCSRKYQQNVGESASGYEIKYDSHIHQTGNVYIEVAEKSDPSLPEYTPSGIMRNDNTIYYLIGDYLAAYLFSKKQLKKIIFSASNEYREKNGIKRKETPTSIAYILPLSFVLNSGYCLETFFFKEEATPCHN